MPFGNFFDGYLVLHSSKYSPERLPYLKKELERVGVKSYELVDPVDIANNDPRLDRYSKGVLSHLCSLIKCIEIAELKKWKNMVFMEDDIKFRSSFYKMWSDVEPQLKQIDWGMVSPFMMPLDGSYVVKEKFFSKVMLVPIRHNILSHIWIFNSDFYSEIKEALKVCLHQGWPADFIYGIISDKHPDRLYATTKNLAGQSLRFKSTLQNARKARLFYGEFRSSISWLDFHVVNLIGKFLKILKR